MSTHHSQIRFVLVGAEQLASHQRKSGTIAALFVTRLPFSLLSLQPVEDNLKVAFLPGAEFSRK